MFSGSATAAACGSPVCSRDSAPVTCSAPASGSSSPVSVASTNQRASTMRSPSGAAQRDRRDAVAVGGGGDRRVLEQDLDPVAVRREQRLDRRDAGARLDRQPAHRRRARVEVGAGAGRGGQRTVGAVVGADRLAQRPVAGGAAEVLDPRVLVGRHGLARELAAEPVRLLAEHHARAALRGGQRGRHAAEPAPRYEHVGQIDEPE